MDLHSQPFDQRGIIRPNKPIRGCPIVSFPDHIDLKGLRGLDLPKGFPVQRFENRSVRIGHLNRLFHRYGQYDSSILYGRVD